MLVPLFGQDTALEWATVISYPLMFVPPVLLAFIVSRNNRVHSKGLALDSCHFAPMGGFVCAVMVMLATVALGFCTDAVNSLMPPMPQFLEDALERMTTGNFVLNFICVSLLAPLCEEWLCRGMVLRGLLGRGVKPVWAIMFSAFFFALIHLNPWQAVPAFLIGLLFGYVYFRTGSLKLTMLMHFTNNTVSLVLSRIDSLQGADNWMDVTGEGSYWIFFALSLVIVGLTVLAFSRVQLRRPRGNFDVLPGLSES